LAGGLST